MSIYLVDDLEHLDLLVEELKADLADKPWLRWGSFTVHPMHTSPVLNALSRHGLQPFLEQVYSSLQDGYVTMLVRLR